MSEDGNVVDGGSAQAPLILADGLNIAGSAWSLMITALHTRAGQGTETIQTAAAVLSMPWPLAKALQSMLKEAVEAYEKTEGAINLPKTFIEKQAARQRG